MSDKCLHFEREEEFSVIVYALTRKERFVIISYAGAREYGTVNIFLFTQEIWTFS